METAGTVSAIKRFGKAAAGAAETIKRQSVPVMKVLNFNPVTELMAKASVLCVLIGRGRLDIAYATRSFSKYHIRAARNYQFAADALPSPSEVASTLAVATRDFDITRADVQMIIPKSMVAMKVASLPSSVRENLSEVVRFDFDRLTPFTADEAIYDYVPGEQGGDKIELFMAAAKARPVTDYISSLADRGIHVKSVTFDMSCLATLCSFATGLPSFIFAEIDKVGIKAGRVENGIFKASSSQDFKCDDEILMAVIVEDFMAEQRAAMGEAGEEMPFIFLFRRDTDTLAEALKTRGKISYKMLDDLEHKVAGASKIGKARDLLIGGMLETLWQKAEKYNLLSKGIREGDKKPLFLTILLVIVMIACIAAYVFVPIATESERLAEIDRQLNARKSEVQSAEKIQREIESINKRLLLINQFKHEKPLYIDMLKEMTTIIPKNTWLTRVRIAGAQVNIEGYAPSATSLVQMLEGSKYFEKVEFSSPTFRDARMNMDRFQIKMDIRGVKAEEAVNEKK